MMVVAASTLEELGRIPRSDEGYQVDALSALREHGAGMFVSRVVACQGWHIY